MSAKRRDLHEIWRVRVLKANEQYRFASAHYRNTQARYVSQEMPSADGSYALQQALRLENQARAEYRKVLRTFVRLVLHGDVPKDEG